MRASGKASGLVGIAGSHCALGLCHAWPRPSLVGNPVPFPDQSSRGRNLAICPTVLVLCWGARLIPRPPKVTVSCMYVDWLSLVLAELRGFMCEEHSCSLLLTLRAPAVVGVLLRMSADGTHVALQSLSPVQCALLTHRWLYWKLFLSWLEGKARVNKRTPVSSKCIMKTGGSDLISQVMGCI